MSDQILVPMDDSEHAGDALRYALETHPTATVTVLHVVGVLGVVHRDEDLIGHVQEV